MRVAYPQVVARSIPRPVPRSEPAPVPFGRELGRTASGIQAFSNGPNSSYVSGALSRLGGRETGIKWQCVEFARRWLMLERGVSFASTPDAHTMWLQPPIVRSLTSSGRFAFERIRNGSLVPPKPGDLLIMERDLLRDIPYGHVAVVVGVERNKVQLAEQNFSAASWRGRPYSRRIAMRVVCTPAGHRYVLRDPAGKLLGSLRVRRARRLGPSSL